MATRLTQEALDFLKNNDVDLYGPISQALNVKVGSLEVFVHRNSRRLTEYPVLKILAKRMSKKPSDLIEEYDDTDIKTGQEIVSK